jgi:hypothetical protein
MFKQLWDASGGNPLISTQADISGDDTVNLITDASIPADKRVVPCWMIWWQADAGDGDFAMILRTTTPVNLWTAGYMYGLSPPVLYDFGATFINRCDLGVGLEVQTINQAGGDVSVVLGYYII